MKLILSSFSILMIYVVGILAQGRRSWGYPFGSELSGTLIIQTMISFYALIRSFRMSWISRNRMIYAYSFFAVLCALVAIQQFVTVGWQILTTIPHQGSENLPTYLFTFHVAMIVGCQQIRFQKLGPFPHRRRTRRKKKRSHGYPSTNELQEVFNRLPN